MTTSETAVVTTEVTEEQSALRKFSERFSDMAETRGWVAKSMSIFGFANRLINGESDADKAEANREYANLIGADTAVPSETFDRVSSDAAAAREGLVEVTDLATDVLSSDEDAADRRDVMSYERALVSAQKSHRAFSKAADLAARNAGTVPEDTEKALEDLANEIDKARDTADTLAEKYAALNVGASS